MQIATKSSAMAWMCVCVMAWTACGDETSVTPKPVESKDADVDMVVDMAPDLEAPDLAQPDMAEPDMPAEDMAPDLAMDPMLSGMWQLKRYENEAPTGEALVSFDLVNVMGKTEVVGTFTQGEKMGDTSGTFKNDTLSLEWENSAQVYQFVTGKLQGATVVGNYNDPNLGGIPQSAVLVRP